MTVKVLKMINGEVIIGEIVSETESTYTVKAPASVMLRENEAGQVGVGMAEYMPYASGDVTIRISAIASESNVDQNLVNEYNRLFGSGIVIAPANSIPKQ